MDSSDRNRLEESRQSFDSIIKNKLLDGLPLLFVINKQDIPNSFSPDEVIAAYRPSLNLIGDRHFLTLPVSALKGNGLQQAIDWIAERIKTTPKPPSESI